MKKFIRGCVSVGSLVVLLASRSGASEQMRSANALESGKLAWSFYAMRFEEKDLQLRLGGSSLIRVPLQGGGTAQFFADADTDLKFDAKGKALMARAVWRPFAGLHYVLKAGAGDMEVRVPSRTVTNILTNATPGRIWGLETGWTLMSDTPVTPAVALSLGFSGSEYNLTRLESGAAAPAAVNQKFSLREWQGGATVSKRWKRFEPYGGMRFFRQQSVLSDSVSADEVSGVRTGFSPFAGFRWEFLPREMLTFEAAGVDERLLAAGLSIGF